MPKGQPNKRYTPEFKIKVVETMRDEKLSYKEAARQFDVSFDTPIITSYSLKIPKFTVGENFISDGFFCQKQK